ncbi:hypothetical protein LPJ56_000622 [Coemansia sp. RSA 2599]|nr:hypothetical protein LPJ75_000238 [Coemansia sp. RSA 2598]KAJ1829113.1 hypothetical protein LPJ56_000622 [Coemansia sp. RSA 2599]
MFAESNLGILGGGSRGIAAVAGGSGALRRPLNPLSSTITSSLLYGAAAEEKIVLDIGTHTLRVGYSGDPRPLYTTELFSGFEPSSNYAGRLVGKAVGLFEGQLESEAHLEALLIEQLRHIYRNHLLVDSKSRKVVIAEGALLPVQVKRALARVLFYNLRVPVVTFYPGSVTSLMTCGKMVGLVVDCGHRSTTVMPVYDCRPLVSCMVSTPMGGGALFRNLRQLILRFGKFQPFSGSSGREGGSGQSECAIDEGALSDEVIRFVMTKLIYASPIAIPMSLGRPPADLGVGAAGKDLVEWFESSLTASNSATKLTVDCPKNGRGSLVFPSWIRERASEILLSGDATQDHKGIVQGIVECIKKSPVDTRRELARNILVVGGVADLPNLKVRLLHDLISTLRVDARWGALADEVALAEEQREGSAANGEAFLASDRCWTGASLAAAARIGGIDVKAEEFDGDDIPDWTSQ